MTNTNTAPEWALARRAFAKLDGLLPYFVTLGNHDLGFDYLSSDRFTLLDKHFQPGQNPLNDKALVKSFEKGSVCNALYQTKIGAETWQVLSLEFGPRNEVVDWACDVMEQYDQNPTILLTHDFIDHYSTLYTATGEARRSQTSSPGSPYLFDIANQLGGVNCGEDLWNKLVSKCSNIVLTYNGHHKPYEKSPISGQAKDAYYLTQSLRRDVRPDGSVCQQVMFNAQWEPFGGNGLMHLVSINKGIASVEMVSNLIKPTVKSTPATDQELMFDLDLRVQRPSVRMEDVRDSGLSFR